MVRRTERLFLLYIVRISLVRTRINLHILVWILIYLSTAIGLTPGGSGTVHIYTQTIIERHK